MAYIEKNVLNEYYKTNCRVALGYFGTEKHDLQYSRGGIRASSSKLFSEFLSNQVADSLAV